MPKDLVISAWSTLKNIEECAKIFNVSVSAMSIRLERLGLI
jgi:Zn-dependent peptidase ImmA (M78 family)